MKRWRARGSYPLLSIPEQHEPGEQKGYRAGKTRRQPSSEHSSRNHGLRFWPPGKWAEGDV